MICHTEIHHMFLLYWRQQETKRNHCKLCGINASRGTPLKSPSSKAWSILGTDVEKSSVVKGTLIPVELNVCPCDSYPGPRLPQGHAHKYSQWLASDMNEWSGGAFANQSHRKECSSLPKVSMLSSTFLETDFPGVTLSLLLET